MVNILKVHSLLETQGRPLKFSRYTCFITTCTYWTICFLINIHGSSWPERQQACIQGIVKTCERKLVTNQVVLAQSRPKLNVPKVEPVTFRTGGTS